MTKFCTKCGRKLEQGEKCTCEKIKKEEKITTQNSLFEKINTFLKNPMDSLKDMNFLEGNEYIFVLFTSLSFGFLSALMPFINPIRTLLSTTIVSFLFFILFAFFVSFMRNTIYKKESKYEEIFKIVSTSSIILLVTNLISFLFSFISFFYSFIFLLFGFLLFILYCYQGLINRNDKNQNNNAYEITIGLFLTIVVMLLGITIL